MMGCSPHWVPTLGVLFSCLAVPVGAASSAPFVFNVSDGGGATLTIGGGAASTFTLQSQFSEPGVDKWTTLQPPWGGVYKKVLVDRSGEAQGRTVVSVQGAYFGLYKLERVYQVEGHRIMVNDTLTASDTVASGWSAVPIYVRHVMHAQEIGSVRDLVLAGSHYTFDCNTVNQDRGSFGAPQMWFATDTAAIGMMPLDDVFRAHGVGFNAALKKYPRAPAGVECAVSAGEMPTLTLADPHLGIEPGKTITLEWAIYPFAETQLDYLDFVNVLRADLKTDTITIPALGQLGWARCTEAAHGSSPCSTYALEHAGADASLNLPPGGDGFLDKHWEEWSPATTAAVLEQQGQIAVSDDESWLRGRCGHSNVKGTAFVYGKPPAFEQYLRNLTKVVNAGGGLPFVYWHTQISEGINACNSSVGPPANGSQCTPLNDAKDFASDRVINASGGQVYYKTCPPNGGDLPLFVPTADNGYGEVMRQFVKQAFQLGFRGVFHDEFGPSLVSYTFNRYDGVSVMMNTNNNVSHLVGHIGLLKDSLELELWKLITMEHGGGMLGNGAPQTRTYIEAQIGSDSPSIHFAENGVEHRAYTVQACACLRCLRCTSALCACSLPAC